MSLFDIFLITGNMMLVMICLVMMIYICCCKKNKMKQKYIRTPNEEMDDREECNGDNEEDKALC